MSGHKTWILMSQTYIWLLFTAWLITPIINKTERMSTAATQLSFTSWLPKSLRKYTRDIHFYCTMPPLPWKHLDRPKIERPKKSISRKSIRSFLGHSIFGLLIFMAFRFTPAIKISRFIWSSDTYLFYEAAYFSSTYLRLPEGHLCSSLSTHSADHPSMC
jgi:hypothetical protein